MKIARALIALLIVAGAYAAIRYVVVVPYQCARVTMRINAETELLMKSTNRVRITSGSRDNTAALRHCRKVMPWNIDVHLLVAANYLLRDRYAEARDVYLEALRWDRRPEIHFELGRTYLHLGEEQKAYEHLLIACSVAPRLTDEVSEPTRGRLNLHINKLRAAAERR